MGEWIDAHGRENEHIEPLDYVSTISFGINNVACESYIDKRTFTLYENPYFRYFVNNILSDRKGEFQLEFTENMAAQYPVHPPKAIKENKLLSGEQEKLQTDLEGTQAKQQELLAAAIEWFKKYLAEGNKHRQRHQEELRKWVADWERRGKPVELPPILLQMVHGEQSTNQPGESQTSVDNETSEKQKEINLFYNVLCAEDQLLPNLAKVPIQSETPPPGSSIPMGLPSRTRRRNSLSDEEGRQHASSAKKPREGE